VATGNVINQAEFKRAELLETQFEDRYGRKTEVLRAVTLSESGLLDHVTIHIKEDGEDYTITEYLTKDQRTDYVLSGKMDKPHKYKDYLSAEVYVADLIGEKKRQKKDKEKARGNLK